MARVLYLKNITEAKKSLKSIGADDEGIKLMAPKMLGRAVKIDGVDARGASILKQDMLSFGGDAALPWDVYSLKKKQVSVILMGTSKQYRRLLNKLRIQPYGLSKLAVQVGRALQNFQSKPTLSIEGYNFDFSKRTYIMGVLNVTPDSFSDGGKFLKVKDAVKQAKAMEKDGADVIDVGGESTRPGSAKISIQEEKARVIPVLEALKDEVKVPISIDSYKPAVVEAALKTGAGIINDINGLRDKAMRQVAVKNQVPVIIMHMQGTPQNMQVQPSYKEVVEDIYNFLEEQSRLVIEEGLDEKKVIIDPGIGFGKTLQHNLEILKRLPEFKSLGFPLLIGTSRKSFIGAVTGAEVNERLFGTIASVSLAAAKGANIVRVHDVAAVKQAVQVVDAIG